MLIQNETLNWRRENINLGANASILSRITSTVIKVGPMNQKKMISSSVTSTVIQEGLFLIRDNESRSPVTYQKFQSSPKRIFFFD